MPTRPSLSIIFLFFCSLSFNVSLSGGDSGESNPFTPKAFAIRYWKTQISNELPKPWFLLNKASPLTAAQYASFSKLAAADPKSLAAQLAGFCSSANLLCFPDLNPSLEKHAQDANFAVYTEKNFTNYGTGRAGGFDSFQKYSENDNIPTDSFRRYSRDSAGHSEGFSAYATGGNVIDEKFNTYGARSTGGDGEFSTYAQDVNSVGIGFTSYSDNSNGRGQGFTKYAQDANTGDQRFASYGKNGNGEVNGFSSYGNNSNVVGSTFKTYGQAANAANDTFASYGFNGNVPQNNFAVYSAGGNAAVDTFSSYRDQSNVGDDSFQSYGKDSSSGETAFLNYGKTFNEGSDKFTSYGSLKTTFSGYGPNNTFKDIDRKGNIVSFANYVNASSQVTDSLAKGKASSSSRWTVEPGKFFREKLLKSGTVMPMPDIRDRMPKRSFLPRRIATKLPFSTSKIGELKELFHAAGDDSTMGKILSDALKECERAPSRGETKRCVTSVEDMIDFATSVLGRNVVVRSTESTLGSSKDILIGSVRGINGGKVTKSVSCHQTLYPYLVYYCHSVPKVRVYEADILDPDTKSRINHGVAICHIDTSSWSPTHGAFVALGSGPGKIEVCHWIFENDMTWAVAD